MMDDGWMDEGSRIPVVVVVGGCLFAVNGSRGGNHSPVWMVVYQSLRGVLSRLGLDVLVALFFFLWRFVFCIFCPVDGWEIFEIVGS